VVTSGEQNRAADHLGGLTMPQKNMRRILSERQEAFLADSRFAGAEDWHGARLTATPAAAARR
jgi:hypothetical protein